MRVRGYLLSMGSAVLAMAPSGDIASAVLTHIPRHATPELEIVLRLDDARPYSGFNVGDHAATIVGNAIRVKGCIGSGGFAVPGSYAVSVVVPPLAAGLYAVQYVRSYCSLFATSEEIVGNWTVEVRDRAEEWPPRLDVVEVFEYWHRRFNHYFVTAAETEKIAIESGRIEGWQRVAPLPGTPASARFAVFQDSGSDRVGLCRFFGTFSGKSSHFYTADTQECELVIANGAWIFEGVVGYAWPTTPAGICARGVPVYRLYNGGMLGAPNHRFTIDAFERSAMIADGWIAEGLGVGVVFCAPQPTEGL